MLSTPMAFKLHASVLTKLEKTMTNVYLNEMDVFHPESAFPRTRGESLCLQANLELAHMGVLQSVLDISAPSV